MFTRFAPVQHHWWSGCRFGNSSATVACRSWWSPPSWIEKTLHTASCLQVRRVFVNDFGAPPEDVFASFEPVPIASASLAQVTLLT